jgi:hypothetical protein
MGNELVTKQQSITDALTKALGASEGNWEKKKLILDMAQRSDTLAKEMVRVFGDESKSESDMPDFSFEGMEEPKDKFLVRGRKMIHVGHGRKGEYEHSIPKDRFDTIMYVLSNGLCNNVGFTSDELKDECSSMPAYHPHFVLKLLQVMNHVKRTGQGRYEFTFPERFKKEAANIWHKVAMEPVEG